MIMQKYFKFGGLLRVKYGINCEKRGMINHKCILNRLVMK
jgi:hypothetical protein